MSGFLFLTGGYPQGFPHYPQRGLCALHFRAGLPKATASFPCSEVERCLSETCSLQAEDPGPTAWASPLSFDLNLGPAGGLCGPSQPGPLLLHFPSMSHTVVACRAYQLHPASQGSLPSGLKSRPRPLHAVRLLLFHQSPPLEPVQAF